MKCSTHYATKRTREISGKEKRILRTIKQNKTENKTPNQTETKKKPFAKTNVSNAHSQSQPKISQPIHPTACTYKLPKPNPFQFLHHHTAETTPRLLRLLMCRTSLGLRHLPHILLLLPDSLLFLAEKVMFLPGGLSLLSGLFGF